MRAAGEVEVIGDVLLVSWQGKIICGDESALFGNEIRERYPEFKHIIVNLQRAELAPTDLPSLLVQYLEAYAEGYRMRFCSASESVAEVLASTHVAEVFDMPVDETEEQSVAAFSDACTTSRNQRALAMTVS